MREIYAKYGLHLEWYPYTVETIRLGVWNDTYDCTHNIWAYIKGF